MILLEEPGGVELDKVLMFERHDDRVDVVDEDGGLDLVPRHLFG